jgi:hypothetical protein
MVVAMSGVAAWGALLSIRSMERGPVWASDHLGAAAIGATVLMGAGVAAAWVVHPRWVGAGVVYLGAVVAFLAWTMRSSLRRAAALGIDGSLPAERRRAVLARTARRLLAAAGFVFAMAAIDLSVRGAPAVFDLILVVALLAPAAAAHRTAMSLDPSRSG